ncbi:PASTA domain-containing protein [Saccharomonospora glauca]|jgi:hypothetical protein|uniref:PASTA domain-containing protein n=1 Tax=Saccharomonospora glauca K62 TaxID=928724 RepID=I1D3K2_9PSEU|nr:PASTA domain-containing protein [Saccharomonospora glauca]EIE99526.1 hypothetical protein SacglDRAFT_02634 [Saccharomonospora glauca K62]
MRAIHRRCCSLLIGVLALLPASGACLPLRAALDGDHAPSRPVPMPSLHGVNLGDGVRALRALGIDDITTVPIDDHLFVFNRDNWIVVRQAPSAGKIVTPGEEVVLSVEKTDEAESRFCFDGDC